MNKITLGIVAALFSANASASWNIVEIDGLGGKDFYASSINDFGQIAGSFFDSNTSSWHAFSTDFDGSNVKDIGSAPNSSVTAGQINNGGQVIVQHVTPPEGDNVQIKYFITESNGNKTELSTISSINGHAIDIVDSGAVAGYYFSPESGFHSFVSDRDANSIKDIGTISGADPIVTNLNNSGQLVGYFQHSSGRTHSFLRDEDGHIIDLGTLGDKYYKSVTAYDVNESGQVIGTTSMDNGRWSQAFITSGDGLWMEGLGTLGGTSSSAVAINDLGQVVGISNSNTGGLDHSFIYANGGLTDLTLLPEVINAGWSDIFVTDINNNGQIIGWGYLENDPGNRHAFMLSFTSDTVFTPQDLFIPNIPEPSTYLMMLAGLGLLGFVAKRNCKTAA